MALPDGVRIAYVCKAAPTPSTNVHESSVCLIQLSDRSYSPKTGYEDVVVDLAFGTRQAAASVPMGVVHVLPRMRVGEKLRLSLSAAQCKHGNGSLPTPCGIAEFGTWNEEDSHELSVELLHSSDERVLFDGVTLLRTEPPVGDAFLPARFARFVVQFQLLSLGAQDARNFVQVEQVEHAHGDRDVESHQLTAPSGDAVYQRWLKQRLYGGSCELQAVDRIDFRVALPDDAVPIGLEEALPFLGNQRVGELLLEPPSGGPKTLLLIHVLEAETQTSLMTPLERVTAASDRKALGSALLSKGDLKLAESAYRAAIDCLGEEASTEDLSADLVAQASQVKLSSWLNLALTCMKKCDWKQVIKAAGRALDIDSKNVKALYRRGVALARQSNFGAAVRDLTAAAEIEPEDASIKRELRVAQAKLHGSHVLPAADPALASVLVSGNGFFSDDRVNKTTPRLEGPPIGERTDAERAESERLKLTCKLMLNQMRESLTNDGDVDELLRDMKRR